MNDIIVEEKRIEDMIYEIRGKQVMLDRDVAKLYQVETRRVNEVIKRNINRFPLSFCFQLTKEEIEHLSLRSQFATLNKNNNMRGQHYKYLPYVLTEQGIMMLSGLLKSDIAVKVNIQIIDAFVNLRKYISTNLIEQNYINALVLEDHENIKSINKDLELLQTSFNKFEEKRKVNEIYFNGQIYDAYYKIYEIFNKAKNSLIIIDSYADNTILDIIKRIKINVIIITKYNNYLTKQDIDKYNKQYNNLKVIYNNSFHDRYFILDNQNVYHCGASINRIGYKTFSITLINDKDVSNVLIDNVNTIMKGEM